MVEPARPFAMVWIDDDVEGRLTAALRGALAQMGWVARAPQRSRRGMAPDRQAAWVVEVAGRRRSRRSAPGSPTGVVVVVAPRSSVGEIAQRRRDHPVNALLDRDQPFLDLVENVDRALADPPDPATTSRQLVALAAGAAALSRLSGREQLVLAGMIRGDTVRQIAESSHVSLATVRTQTRAIHTKLGVASQLEAAAFGHRFAHDGPVESARRELRQM